MQVVGFDMVDDESKPERRPHKHMNSPADWNSNYNPAYAYYAYYTYANLYALNKLREARGLNIISFRPHAGEQLTHIGVIWRHVWRPLYPVQALARHLCRSKAHISCLMSAFEQRLTCGVPRQVRLVTWTTWCQR